MIFFHDFSVIKDESHKKMCFFIFWIKMVFKRKKPICTKSVLWFSRSKIHCSVAAPFASTCPGEQILYTRIVTPLRLMDITIWSFLRCISWMAFLVEVSGINSSLPRLECLSVFQHLFFRSTKMLFVMDSSFLVSWIFVRAINPKKSIVSFISTSRRDCEWHGAKDSILFFDWCPRIPSLKLVATPCT